MANNHRDVSGQLRTTLVIGVCAPIMLGCFLDLGWIIYDVRENNYAWALEDKFTQAQQYDKADAALKWDVCRRKQSSAFWFLPTHYTDPACPNAPE